MMRPSVGCGKTVLFANVVEHLRKESTTAPILSAYFYCLYRKGAQHELASILRTFIAQICPSSAVPTSLKDLYEFHSRKFPPGVASDSELKSTLLSMISDPQPFFKHDYEEGPHIFLLIDALDELPLGSHRDEIIGFLAELAALHLPRVHLLATSRDESDIQIGLGSWSGLSVAKERVIEDIKLYVTRVIREDKGLSRIAQKQPAIEERLLLALAEDGNGM